MKSIVVHAVTLCTVSLYAQLTSAFSSGLHERSPVEKVVQLVETLQEDLKNDARREELIYDKYACWCTATSERKGKSIEEDRTELKTLGSKILQMKAEVSRLASNIHTWQVDIKDTEIKMNELTLQRQKEHNSYMALSSEYEQALAVLAKAGMVTGFTTLLQANDAGGAQIRQAVTSAKKVIEMLPESTIGSLPPAKLALLKQFVTDAAKLDGKAIASFTPMTSTLGEILKTLGETLTSEHDTIKAEEKQSAKSYQDLMKTENDKLKLLQEDKMKADEALMIKTEAELASKEQLYDDITAQREADVAFFTTMEQNCKDKESEWQERKSLRDEELLGIKQALEILTSDSARDIFRQAAQPGIATEKEQREYVPAVWEAETKTLNKTLSFLQVKPAVRSATSRAARQHAFEVLKEQASRSHSLRLAEIASKIRLGQNADFKPVIDAIDGVVAELNEEGKQDMLKRDECTEKYKTLASESADFSWKIEKNIAMIEKIEGSIADAQKKKAETIEMIEEVDADMKESTEQRTAAQQEYEAQKKLDEDAIKLLQDAKAALMAYWEKHGMSKAAAPVVKQSLLQDEPVFDVSPDQAPNATFSYKGHRGGQTKTLTSLLQKILEELENEIVVATSENEAQIANYDNFQAKGAKYKELLEKQRDALGEYITGKETDKTAEQSDKQGNEGSLQERVDTKKAITDDCDFIMGAWSERRAKRKAEMEGLVQAKAFLKGAEMDE